MNKKLAPIYKQFRVAGNNAAVSLRSAKTVLAFRKLESEGLVRMRVEPETESYLDSYGEPEEYIAQDGRHVSAKEALEELLHTLETYGCWWTCSEVLVDGTWEHADSCGMHTGYKNPLCPVENCYVVDEMQAALDKHSIL